MYGPKTRVVVVVDVGGSGAGARLGGGFVITTRRLGPDGDGSRAPAAGSVVGGGRSMATKVVEVGGTVEEGLAEVGGVGRDGPDPRAAAPAAPNPATTTTGAAKATRRRSVP